MGPHHQRRLRDATAWLSELDGGVSVDDCKAFVGAPAVLVGAAAEAGLDSGEANAFLANAVLTVNAAVTTGDMRHAQSCCRHQRRSH